MRLPKLLAAPLALVACSCAGSQAGSPPGAAAAGRAESFATVPVGGGELRYASAGRGEPLVLLHAGRQDLHMWDAVAPRLAEQNRVIRWDARGHGASTAPATPSADTAEDLRLLLDHLRIRRATLVGFSMGAGTAFRFAILYPERVERLVLISVSGPPSGAPLPPSAGAPPNTAEGRALLRQAGVPILVIFGEEDSESVRSTGAAIAAEVPSARMIVLPAVAHDLVARRPLEIAAAILGGDRPQPNRGR